MLAHSMGGLDMRYAIAHFDIAEKLNHLQRLQPHTMALI